MTRTKSWGAVINDTDIQPWHIMALARDIRKEDLHEVEAGAGMGVEVVVQESVRLSTYGGAIFWKESLSDLPPSEEYQNGLACIWGVCPVEGLEGAGIPWLLGTKEMDRHPRLVMECGWQQLTLMQQRFNYLYNYVHASNKRSIRFLKWLGFRLEEPAPWGAAGEMFRRFSWSKVHV